MHRIAPCLWFDDQAEEAPRFYAGIFSNSKITKLDGQPFTALNGGPRFRFNEALSLQKKLDIAKLKKAFDGD